MRHPRDGDHAPPDGHTAPAPGAAPGGAPARAAAPAVSEAAEAAQALRRFDAEREERRRATNAVAGRIAVAIAALFLAFLTYDSTATAVRAHSRGDAWIYPPAVVGGVCAAGLVVLLTWGWRRRRLGM
ncbi:hypothetical protein [Actinomadura sp. NPDC049753]|uniref:hypothetical protein n=1 Tax=Actinomadura sp. NPDC049753 TaxID=3154739 RepID=UPI00342823D7